MKTEALKNKVISRLINSGNNAGEVTKMVDLHFAYAAKTYSTVKAISECIRAIY